MKLAEVRQELHRVEKSVGAVEVCLAFGICPRFVIGFGLVVKGLEKKSERAEDIGGWRVPWWMRIGVYAAGGAVPHGFTMVGRA